MAIRQHWNFECANSIHLRASDFGKNFKIRQLHNTMLITRPCSSIDHFDVLRAKIKYHRKSK